MSGAALGVVLLVVVSSVARPRLAQQVSRVYHVLFG